MNPADLNHFVFSDAYPLHSNAAILNIGSAGSGKSYYCYRVLVPIYVKYAGVRSILICSRTGKFDSTTSKELANSLYESVNVEFISVDESFSMAQRIRANAIINGYLERLMRMSSEDELESIRLELGDQISNAGELTVLQAELKKLAEYTDKLIWMSMQDIRDSAELLFKRGTRVTYNPTVIVFDDMSGSDTFMRPYSDIHKLIYCRRHLHLTMIMNVQSLTTVSTNVRRNSTVFVCFSTLSEKDLKLLSDRLPIRWTYNELREAFIQISEADDRNDKVLTLFTVYPNQKVVIGSPREIKNMLLS